MHMRVSWPFVLTSISCAADEAPRIAGVVTAAPLARTFVSTDLGWTVTPSEAGLAIADIEFTGR